MRLPYPSRSGINRDAARVQPFGLCLLLTRFSTNFVKGGRHKLMTFVVPFWTPVVNVPQKHQTTDMAKTLSTKDRKKLNKKSFALPGKRKYPIPDKAHARNALARVAQHGTPGEKKKVTAAVTKRFPSLAKRKKGNGKKK
jgi:hypothetical protein